MSSKQIVEFDGVPITRAELDKFVFPQARTLINVDGYFSADDPTLLERWIDESVVPALSRASASVQDGLRACLEPRTSARLALSSVTIDFINSLLPHYPQGLAQVVAALVVLTAYELRERKLL